MVYRLSPSGRYALIFPMKTVYMPNLLLSIPLTGGDNPDVFMRLSDGAAWKENHWLTQQNPSWVNDTQCYFYDTGQHVLHSQRLEANGVLTSQQLTVGQTFNSPRTFPSPDQRYLMIVEQQGDRRAAFVELPTLRLLPLTLSHGAHYWWQSAHAVGYEDEQHGGHIVDVISLTSGR